MAVYEVNKYCVDMKNTVNRISSSNPRDANVQGRLMKRDRHIIILAALIHQMDQALSKAASKIDGYNAQFHGPFRADVAEKIDDANDSFRKMAPHADRFEYDMVIPAQFVHSGVVCFHRWFLQHNILTNNGHISVIQSTAHCLNTAKRYASNGVFHSWVSFFASHCGNPMTANIHHSTLS